MAQSSPPHPRRALIVEDEIFFAINLEADMHALGFDICDPPGADNGGQPTPPLVQHKGVIEPPPIGDEGIYTQAPNPPMPSMRRKLSLVLATVFSRANVKARELDWTV